MALMDAIMNKDSKGIAQSIGDALFGKALTLSDVEQVERYKPQSPVLTIQDFLAHIKRDGIQKNNTWHIHITVPQLVLATNKVLFEKTKEILKSRDLPSMYTAGATLGGLNIERTISLMATNVDIPGTNVSYAEMHVGTTRRIAFDKSTGDLNVTFRCSGPLYERKLFEAWVKAIFKKDHSVEYYSNYIGNVNIQCLSPNNEITYDCDLDEVYPLVITDLNLDRTQTDQVLEFQVTFAYRKYNADIEFLEQIKRSQLPWFDGQTLASSYVPPPVPTKYDLGFGSNNPIDWVENLLFGKSGVISDSLSEFAGQFGILQYPMKKYFNKLVYKVEHKYGDKAHPATQKLNKVLDKFGFPGIRKPVIELPKIFIGG